MKVRLSVVTGAILLLIAFMCLNATLVKERRIKRSVLVESSGQPGGTGEREASKTLGGGERGDDRAVGQQTPAVRNVINKVAKVVSSSGGNMGPLVDW